jgi:hypothetical protein
MTATHYRRFIWLTLAVGIAVLSRVNVAMAQALILDPPNPRAMETVRVKALWSATPEANHYPTVQLIDGKIIVFARYRSSGIVGPGPTPRFDVVLGKLPGGTYEIEYRGGGLTGPEFIVDGRLTFTVSDIGTNRTAPFPNYDYTDLWWNANESGWGINITVKNDKLFGAWFVYGADGKPTWYTIQPGSWTNSTTYSGVVVKATGPAFGGIGPLAGGVTPALAGNATITFTSYDTATITGTVDGQAVNKSITRQVF